MGETDLISRQAAIDAFDCTNELIVCGAANAQNVVNYINKVVGKIKALPSAQPRHKVRFGDADHVWIDGKQYISLQRFGEAVKDAQSQRIKGRMNDFISRREAIDALWKALYAYEDKTEKQFKESDELDVSDWIEHRIFVQNMSDIDRQTILALPSVQRDTDEFCTDCKEYDTERHCCPRFNRVIREAMKDAEIIRCKDCVYYDPTESDEEESDWCHVWGDTTEGNAFCSYAERKGEQP